MTLLLLAISAEVVIGTSCLRLSEGMTIDHCPLHAWCSGAAYALAMASALANGGTTR